MESQKLFTPTIDTYYQKAVNFGHFPCCLPHARYLVNGTEFTVGTHPQDARWCGHPRQNDLAGKPEQGRHPGKVADAGTTYTFLFSFSHQNLPKNGIRVRGLADLIFMHLRARICTCFRVVR